MRTHLAISLAALLLVPACCPPRKALPSPEAPPAPPAPPPAPVVEAPKCPEAPAAPPPKDDRVVVLEGTPQVPEALKQRMAQYQSVRRASFADLDAEGRRVLVTTEFGSSAQAHLVSQPGGDRRQLTFGKEPVAGLQFVPDGSAVTFTQDAGGNENHQIFRLDLGSGKRTLLTDGTSRNEAFVFSKDGARMAFKSNARNGKDMDLWIGDGKGPAGNRLLAQVSGDFSPIAFSNDGGKLLALEYKSIEHSRLHVVDIASGQLTAVTPEGRASYRAAVWDREDRGLFVASDREGDFLELYHLDLATKKFAPLSRDIHWNVGTLTISDDGKTLAFVANEGGLDRLYLLDTKSKKRTLVSAIPEGVLGNVKFAKRAPRLGLGFESATRTADAYVYDLKKKSLSRWTESEIGGLSEKHFVPASLVKVKSWDGLEVPAFYFKPKQASGAALILIHGGPEAQATPAFSAFVQYLAADLGIAVLEPNVRGSDGYGKKYLGLDNGKLREGSVKDIGAFLDWIATQKDLDPKRVGVYGGSYGGYMVLASLVHFSDRIAAGADNVGISNFVSFLENTKGYRRDLRRVEYGDERDPDMRTFLQGISPLTHVDKIKSALFVLQGANDPRVPVTEAEQIVKAVKASGKDVWYMLARNEGHGFRKRENRDLSQQLLVMFFEKHLLGR